MHMAERNYPPREVTVAAYKILDEYPIPFMLLAEATYIMRGSRVEEEIFYLSIYAPNWEGGDIMLCDESQGYILELLDPEVLKDLQIRLDDNLAEELYEDPWYDGDWPQLCKQFKSEKAWEEERKREGG